CVPLVSVSFTHSSPSSLYPLSLHDALPICSHSNLLPYLVFIPEVIFPFPRAADEPPQAHALLYGGSSRPLLPQECQNHPRNDRLFFPLYLTRIFIFLY